MNVITTNSSKTSYSANTDVDYVEYQYDSIQSDVTFNNQGSYAIDLIISTIPIRNHTIYPGMSITLNNVDVSGFLARSLKGTSLLQIISIPSINEPSKIEERMDSLNSQLADIAPLKLDSNTSVDNGIVINNALTQSKHVVLPAGTYYVDTTININADNACLKGIPGKTTLIKRGNTPLIKVSDTSASTYYNGISIKDIIMQGDGTSGIGIDAYKLGGFYIERCKISNFISDGVRLFDVTNFGSYRNDIRNNGGNGISGGYKTDSGTFLNTNFQNNTGYGLVIGFKPSTSNVRCNANNIEGCSFLGNQTAGLLIRDASTNGTNIKGNYFENNLNSHIVVGENGGSNVSAQFIEGNYFNGSTTSIKVYNVDYLSVKGNFFENTGSLCLKLNVAVDCEWFSNTSDKPIEDWSTVQYTSGYRRIKFGRGMWDLQLQKNIGFVLPKTTVGNRPTASVNLEGYVYVLDKGSSNINLPQICLKDASGNYNWFDLKIRLYGPTANRPVLGGADVNTEYYDTDIQKPIWWNGSVWKDAMSNTV